MACEIVMKVLNATESELLVNDTSSKTSRCNGGLVFGHWVSHFNVNAFSGGNIHQSAIHISPMM